MEKWILDLVNRYCEEFGYTPVIADDKVLIRTAYGDVEISLENDLMEVRSTPIDKTNEEHATSLVKIRKHFAGRLKSNIEERKQQASDEKPSESPKVEQDNLGRPYPAQPDVPPKHFTKGESKKKKEIIASKLLPESAPEKQKAIPGTVAYAEIAAAKELMEKKEHLEKPEPKPEVPVIPEVTLDDIMDGKVEKPTTSERPQEEPVAPAPKGEDCILTKLLDIFDSDVLEIFGDTGVGKTIFCQEIAIEAAQKGHRVIYIDSEKNVGRKTRKRFATLKNYKEMVFHPSDGIKSQVTGPGFYYLYTPTLNELSTITKNLPTANLVIIDSLGMPVLVKYSRMKQNEQGHVLQEMIAIKGDLKEWAYRSGGLAIDVNQPVSEMGKSPQQIKDGLPAFGDKSGFATKSVMKFVKVSEAPNKTVIDGNIYKSRDFGKGTKILTLDISDEGVKIKMLT